MLEKPEIVIVIPTYNEYENMEAIVNSITTVLPYAKMLFVDDNSPDGTALKIKDLQRGNTNIILLQRKAKSGLGTAYLDAFQEILSNRFGQIIVTMDADLSHPIKTLPAMIDAIRDCDVIVGSRYVTGGGIIGWSMYRKLLSQLANMYVRTLIKIPIHDLTSGFSVMKIETLSSVMLEEIHSNGYSFQIELKYLLHKLGWRMLEYPIFFTERHAGESKLSIRIIIEAIFLPLRLLGRKPRLLRRD